MLQSYVKNYKVAFVHAFKFTIKPFDDVIRLIDGFEIQEAIDESYSINGKEETAIIVRSKQKSESI